MKNLRLTEKQLAEHQKRVRKPAAAPRKTRPGNPAGVKKAKSPVSLRDLRSEHQIQAAFVQRIKLLERRYPILKLSFAIPNAGAGAQSGQAGKLKAEGVRPGVPDWCLPVSTISCKNGLGLWIEFKSARGRLSRAQIEYAESLRAQGHQVNVCRDDAEAERIVLDYIGAV